MANDTLTIRAYVKSALKDTTAQTWADADIDSLVSRAVASLYPRVQIPLDSHSASYDQTLTAETYYYAIPAAIVSLSRVDLVDSDDVEHGPLPTGTWEITGNLLAGTAFIHIDPSIVDNHSGGEVRYHGYGRYDLTTNLIPDDYIPYVVAHARSAAFGWLTSDRVRFRQWLGSDQTTNTSVNELGQMVRDAQRDAEMERSRIFTWRKPMPGRLPS